MTAVEHRRPPAANTAVIWAWVALALEPLGPLVGLFLLGAYGWAEADSPGAGGGDRALILIAIPWLVAPATAAYPAARAARARRQSGIVAAIGAGVLTLATFALLVPLFSGITYLICLGVAIAVLGLSGWLSGKRPDDT